MPLTKPSVPGVSWHAHPSRSFSAWLGRRYVGQLTEDDGAWLVERTGRAPVLIVDFIAAQQLVVEHGYFLSLSEEHAERSRAQAEWDLRYGPVDDEDCDEEEADAA